MKITCSLKLLTEALSTVIGIVPKKSQKPILQNVKLEARDGSVVMIATDLGGESRC